MSENSRAILGDVFASAALWSRNGRTTTASAARRPHCGQWRRQRVLQRARPGVHSKGEKAGLAVEQTTIQLRPARRRSLTSALTRGRRAANPETGGLVGDSLGFCFSSPW